MVFFFGYKKKSKPQIGNGHICYLWLLAKCCQLFVGWPPLLVNECQVLPSSSKNLVRTLPSVVMKPLSKAIKIG